MKKLFCFAITMLLVLCLALSAYAALSDRDIMRGDADGNGVINIRDVTLILQYIAGWDVEFGTLAPEPEAVDKTIVYITGFIPAQTDDDADIAVITNSTIEEMEVNAADLGITAETPKVSYLGLPVTLSLDVEAENFTQAKYNRGDANILSAKFDEYTSVTNLGDGKIKAFVDNENIDNSYINFDGTKYYRDEYLFGIAVFGKDGWGWNYYPLHLEETGLLELFEYDSVNGSYVNNYGTYVTVQFADTGRYGWDDDSGDWLPIIDVLVTPISFGQYNVRELMDRANNSAPTDFATLAYYTEDAYVNYDEEESHFQEVLVGSWDLDEFIADGYNITAATTSVSSANGKNAKSLTLAGEDVNAGDFIFYSYNGMDNILTVAKNCGTFKTGRLTAKNSSKETVKIDGIIYEFGFAGPIYPAGMPSTWDDYADDINIYLEQLEAGENNAKYITVDGKIVYMEPIAKVHTDPTYDFVIISRDAERVADVLGVSDEKYAKNLSGVTYKEDGVYIDDNGHVAVAVLSKTTGKWELGYIKAVLDNYDYYDNVFETSYNVATLATYTDMFTSPAEYNKYDNYVAADAILTSNGTDILLAAVEVEDGNVYTVASPYYEYELDYYDTVSASLFVTGDFTYGYFFPENATLACEGIIFSDNNPKTNAITCDNFVEAERVTVNEETVIMVYDAVNGLAGTRVGVQGQDNSYYTENGSFLAVSSDLIALIDYDGTEDMTAWAENAVAEGKDNSENKVEPTGLDFVITSTKASLVSRLLGISEEKYYANLVGSLEEDDVTEGVYVDDNGHVAIAVLSQTTGKWELGYIDSVEFGYDYYEREFEKSLDVATLAREIDMFNFPWDYRFYDDYYSAASFLFPYRGTDNVLAVVEKNDNVYKVAWPSYVYEDGDDVVECSFLTSGDFEDGTFISDGTACEGLVFSNSNANTNRISAYNDVDTARVTVDDETVIIVLDKSYGTAGARVGVQGKNNSYYTENGSFLAASSDLIVLVDWDGSLTEFEDEDGTYGIPTAALWGKNAVAEGKDNTDQEVDLTDLDLVIISRDAERVADVLGVSDEKYANNLSGVTDDVAGVYVADNGHVAVAVLSKTTGKWELGYIKSVLDNYDYYDNVFETSYNVATLATYTDMFTSPAEYNKYDNYVAADAILTSNGTDILLAAVKVEDGNVYTVASPYYEYELDYYDTVSASFFVTGDFTYGYFVDDNATVACHGLIFSDNNTKTNKITCDNDVDAERVTVDEETVIIVYDAANGTAGARVGIQNSDNSYLTENGSFLAASADLIVLVDYDGSLTEIPDSYGTVTLPTVTVWADRISDEDETWYIATADTEVELEISSTNPSNYLVNIRNLFDMKTLEIVESVTVEVEDIDDRLICFGHDDMFLHKRGGMFEIEKSLTFSEIITNVANANENDLGYVEVDESAIEFDDFDTIDIVEIQSPAYGAEYKNPGEAVDVVATVVTLNLIQDAEDYDLNGAVLNEQYIYDNGAEDARDIWGIGSADIIYGYDYDGEELEFTVWDYPLNGDKVEKINEPTTGILDSYIFAMDGATLLVPRVDIDDYADGIACEINVEAAAAYEDGVVYLTVYKVIYEVE